MDAAISGVRYLRQSVQAAAALRLADLAFEACENGATCARRKGELLCAKGVALVALGRVAEAEAVLRESHSTFETLGPQHEDDLTMAQNQLAICLEDSGHGGAAESMYLSSLQARERVHGVEHLQTAASLTNLASYHLGRCQLHLVNEPLNRALTMWEKLRQGDHPDYATALDIRGILFAYQGDYLAAKLDLDRAFCIRRARIGAQHPHTATSRNNLGSLELLLGNAGDAQKHFQEAVKARIHSRGPAHYETLIARANGLVSQLSIDEDAAYAELQGIAEAQQVFAAGKFYFALDASQNNLRHRAVVSVKPYTACSAESSLPSRMVVFERVKRFFGDRP